MNASTNPAATKEPTMMTRRSIRRQNAASAATVSASVARSSLLLSQIASMVKAWDPAAADQLQARASEYAVNAANGTLWALRNAA